MKFHLHARLLLPELLRHVLGLLLPLLGVHAVADVLNLLGQLSKAIGSGQLPWQLQQTLLKLPTSLFRRPAIQIIFISDLNEEE